MSWAETYNYFNFELADARTNDFFLVNNPIHLLTIIFAYLYFILKCGPNFMENRKAFSCKTFIFYYNIFQILANAYIVNEIVHSGWLTIYSLGCEPVRYSNDPIHIKMRNAVYWTFILKVIDLVETPIYTLRKKWNQISFLHVYHHISTVLVTWIQLKYTAGGMMSMLMIINGSIHIMMYTYYLLASLGPTVQSVIKPFKPYVTTLQIIQFIFLILHQSQGLLPSCPIPKAIPMMNIGNLLVNLVLFYNFYRVNYKRKQS